MCVSSARPLTSPIAYSQSCPGRAGRRRPRAAGRRRARPSRGRCPSVPGVRPTRDEQLVASTRRAVVELEHDLAVARETRVGRGAAAARRRRARAAPSSTCVARERLLAGDQPVAALDERHVRAERRRRLRQLDADHAAAEDAQPRRAPRCAVVASRFVHGRASRRPGIGGMRRRRARRDDDARWRATSTSSPTRTRRSPSSAPRPRTSVDAALSSHGSCAASSRSWITSSRRAAPRRRRVPVAASQPRDAPRPREQLARPQQRLRRHARVVRALAADERLLDDRDGSPPSEPAGRHLAGRRPPRSPPRRTRACGSSPQRTLSPGTIVTTNCRDSKAFAVSPLVRPNSIVARPTSSAR